MIATGCWPRCASASETGRFSIEYRWQCADGGYKHFLDQAVLVKDGDDGTTEFAGTLTDVTEQRTLESRLLQAQKMDAIGQLTGGIAHDFNNLLSAVLGGLHLLERRLTLERARAADRRPDAPCRRAGRRAGPADDGLRPQAGSDARPASIRNRCANRSPGWSSIRSAGLIGIDWSCSGEVDNLFVDQSQLELALVNLILNARDAMPRRRPDRRSRSMRYESGDDNDQLELPPGSYVRIRVSDEGEGIPAEIVDRITEPFFTTKEAGKGTGLGLSMVAGFVQQSGGRLRIGSKPGEGTTVELILPSTPLPAPVETRSRTATSKPLSTARRCCWSTTMRRCEPFLASSSAKWASTSTKSATAAARSSGSRPTAAMTCC